MFIPHSLEVHHSKRNYIEFGGNIRTRTVRRSDDTDVPTRILPQRRAVDLSVGIRVFKEIRVIRVLFFEVRQIVYNSENKTG